MLERRRKKKIVEQIVNNGQLRQKRAVNNPSLLHRQRLVMNRHSVIEMLPNYLESNKFFNKTCFSS